MVLQQNATYKIVLAAIGLLVLIMGISSYFITSSLFPDPAIGFQVLRCMQMGGSFNNLTAPDQGDIATTYSQFLTWWSPGQYLVPHFFSWIISINLGQASAVTTTLAELCGLTGFYCFFTKIGFTRNIATISLLFIVCQRAFMIPHDYYNGGEILLFSFEGWFLYGCITVKKPGVKLVLFILISGFVGFFLKSSFLWIYAAGLFCCWVGICLHKQDIIGWLGNALWIGIPGVVPLIVIYVFFLSKGESPVTAPAGFTLTSAMFSYPLASPLLAGYSVDDLFNGLVDHIGPQYLTEQQDVVALVVLALLSITMVYYIIRYVPNKTYKIYLSVFYVASVLFFSITYLRQVDVSMESRHFRIVGLLIVPGIIYLADRFKPVFKILFALVFIATGINSFNYLIHGYKNNYLQARGVTGISQPNIGQATLNEVMKLDRENRNLTFVFIGDDVGLEIVHNRIIPLQPIGNDPKITIDDYKFGGHAGPLYIVLPSDYKGDKEKMILGCFSGYKDFKKSSVEKGFAMYSAK